MDPAPKKNDIGPEEPLLSTPPDPFQNERTVLILVGLIASGKSTFAEALERHFPRFRRCNQDDLGNRSMVEDLATHTLLEGRSPCIDRTNFDVKQRSYWTTIARAFPKTSISIIVFDTPYHVRAEPTRSNIDDEMKLTHHSSFPYAQVCASRLERRTSHPTIKNAKHGMAVLKKFASDFQLPSPDEDYDHIIYLRPADHPRPEYSRDDVSSILGRLKASSRNAGVIATQRRIESHFGRAGSHSRTNRARGYRGGGGHQGFSSSRGTLYGSAWSVSGVGGPNDSNWRRPSSGAVADREELAHQRSATGASVPAMESSKGRSSAEERHNCT